MVRVVQIGYPWQYMLPEWKVQIAIFRANFMVRMLLNKVLPSVFHKPIFLQIA